MPEITLSKNTLISVGAALAVAVPLFTAAMWVKDRIDSAAGQATSKLDSIDRRLERMEIANRNTLTRGEFESFSLRLARDNATLKVPEFHQ